MKNNYQFNNKMLKELKKEAKKVYKDFIQNAKLPLKSRKLIVPGVYGSDYSIHYKTNGLKNFVGFLVVISGTKEHIYLKK